MNIFKRLTDVSFGKSCQSSILAWKMQMARSLIRVYDNYFALYA